MRIGEPAEKRRDPCGAIVRVTRGHRDLHAVEAKNGRVIGHGPALRLGADAVARIRRRRSGADEEETLWPNAWRGIGQGLAAHKYDRIAEGAVERVCRTRANVVRHSKDVIVK